MTPADIELYQYALAHEFIGLGVQDTVVVKRSHDEDRGCTDDAADEIGFVIRKTERPATLAQKLLARYQELTGRDGDASERRVCVAFEERAGAVVVWIR